MIKKIDKVPASESIVFLVTESKDTDIKILSTGEIDYIKKQNKKYKKELIALNHLDKWIFIQFIKNEKNIYKRLESCRRAGNKLLCLINENKIDKIIINDLQGNGKETLAFAEGMALGNYQFHKYKKDIKEKKNSLNLIQIFSNKVNKSAVEQLNIIIESTFKCRDLVNEPSSYLNAAKFSEEVQNLAEDAGAKIEILNKNKIEALKMGGLLAVNKGSIEPPTFTIFEWEPKKAVNKNPIVFVGKGVVFDTGGLNIKTGNFMETMKCDMSGAATVAAAIYAIAKAKLPVYVIGLMPATDNRPNANAYAPGDIIKMHNGLSVEIINTDAEGRLILADALSYAQKYKPDLVIDIATLTGAAARAIGKYGIVAMQSKSEKEFERLKKSGENVYERIVEFPFWDEYDDLIKSEIADIKNLGAKEAGAITAGKFLEHFTDYPYIHLDIAGTAFFEKNDSYRPAGGTGIGVRLLFDFAKNKTNDNL